MKIFVWCLLRVADDQHLRHCFNYVRISQIFNWWRLRQQHCVINHKLVLGTVFLYFEPKMSTEFIFTNQSVYLRLRRRKKIKNFNSIVTSWKNYYIYWKLTHVFQQTCFYSRPNSQIEWTRVCPPSSPTRYVCPFYFSFLLCRN